MRSYSDDVLPAHEVNEAAVKRGAEFALLMLNVQRDNVFPSLAAVDHEKFHKIGLALTGVAEDEYICRCLVLITLVEVREDVASSYSLRSIKSPNAFSNLSSMIPHHSYGIPNLL